MLPFEEYPWLPLRLRTLGRSQLLRRSSSFRVNLLKLTIFSIDWLKTIQKGDLASCWTGLVFVLRRATSWSEMQLIVSAGSAVDPAAVRDCQASTNPARIA